MGPVDTSQGTHAISVGPMFGLQGIVPGNPETRDTDVDDRDPTLNLVVSNAVHPVGKTDGRDSSRYFQAGKSGGVVDYVVGNQDFFSAASLEVARGGVVKGTEDSDAGEQQDIGSVPKSVGRERRLGRRC